MAELTREVSPDAFGTRSPTHSCKPSPLCPHCHGSKVWRDGTRESIFGDTIQRWLCRSCGLRFSDPEDVKNSWSKFEKITRSSKESLKTQQEIAGNRQICVEETKNLAAEQQTTEVLRRNETGDVKGKILEYAWWLKKDGKSDATIQGRTKLLLILTKRGASLYDPEQ